MAGTVFPERLPCGSFLAYSPRGKGKLCDASRKAKDQVKGGRVGNYVKRLRENGYVDALLLEGCLGPGVTLVPVPRSAPLAKGEAFWPAAAIARMLLAEGLADEVIPLVERVTAIRASSTSFGNRPDPKEHAATMGIKTDAASLLLASGRITLVDDIVTRGSTFVGAAAVLLGCFPAADVSCFAMIRTASSAKADNELGRIDLPLVELITYHESSDVVSRQ